MKLAALPYLASLEAYDRQAEQLLEGHKSGDSAAICVFHECHPCFLDATIKWLPRTISDSEIRETGLNLDDARLATARWYNFRDWDALAQHVQAVTAAGSSIFLFESAVEAVIGGNLRELNSLLQEHRELAQARSCRITCFDPPVHRATLLHY